MGASDEVRYCKRLFDWPMPTTEATQRPMLSDFSGTGFTRTAARVSIAIRNRMWFQLQPTSALMCAITIHFWGPMDRAWWTCPLATPIS
ncbi:hypothetical protein AVEN_261551-1 [Araneus ventricosus]|uniref:Uncharacterized protein n=1 Tax=Araneus ventricosus TaxID=182803 RepID=A0A4Y2RIT3_ARAVE|nr:hypothetical protein AVEN_261551-1 [Araneus ventricosus]